MGPIKKMRGLTSHFSGLTDLGSILHHPVIKEPEPVPSSIHSQLLTSVPE